MNLEILTLPVILLALATLMLVRRTAWTENSLKRYLDRYGIIYDSWGRQPDTKTLRDLLKSLQNGEVRLESRYGRAPLLHIEVAVITIWCTRNDNRYTLREFRKIDLDGEYLERRHTGSIGEKVKTRLETHEEAARRGLKEELGFYDAYDLKLAEGVTQVLPTETSDFYPGLHDVYHRHHYQLDLGRHSRHFRHRYVQKIRQGEAHFRWVQQTHIHRVSKENMTGLPTVAAHP